MSDSDDESIHTDVSEQTIEIKSELTNETNENRTKHVVNKTGSMIIKRRELSMDGNLELFNEMDKKWSKSKLLNDAERAQLINSNNGVNSGNTGDNDDSKDGNDDEVHGLLPLSAEEEVELVEKERDILERSWTQYIDLQGDGDVDRKEWLAGAGRAKIQLNEEELNMVFNYLDKDKTGFIDKNDFCEFMQMGYSNVFIKKVQKAVLDAFGSKYLHQRRQSNLIHKDSQDWGNYDLRMLEQDMANEMKEMVTDLKKKATEEAEFVQQIEQRHESNPELFKPERAREWTEFEVVAWLEQLQFQQYSKYFAQEKITGDMLLDDIDEMQLINHLGVKPVHAQKILREIIELRKAIRLANGNPLDFVENVIDIHQEDVDKKFESFMYETKIDKLNEEIINIKKEYEAKISELEQQKTEILNELNDLKKNGIKRRKDDDDDDDDDILLPSMNIDDNNGTHKKNKSISLPPQAVGGKKIQKFVTMLKLKGNDDESSSDDEDYPDDVSIHTEEIIEDTIVEDAIIEDRMIDETKSNNNDNTSNNESTNIDETKSNNENNSNNIDSKINDESKSSNNNDATKLDVPQTTQKVPSKKKLGKLNKNNRHDFCSMDADKIMKWSNEEVAYWMIKIGFEKYSYGFFIAPIDGDMLIRDLTLETLIEDLNVKKIHGKRIIREVNKLRSIINGGITMDIGINDLNIKPDNTRPKQETIDDLNERINELESQRTELMNELENNQSNDSEQKGYFSTKIQELESENNELTDKNTKQEELIKEAQNELSELRTQVETLEREKKKYQMKSEGIYVDDDDMDNNDDEKQYTIDEVEDAIQFEINRNDYFGDVNNALDWTKEEVAHWLKTLQLKIYIASFFNKHIDGSILLNDVNKEMLQKTLKVKNLHLTKIVREIQSIKDKLGIKTNPNNNNDNNNSNNNNNSNIDDSNIYRQENETLRDKITELETLLKEEQSQRAGLDLEISNLKTEMDNLQKGKTEYNEQKYMDLLKIYEYEQIKKEQTLMALNKQMNTLRKAARIMQKEIIWYQREYTKNPVDSLLGLFGYSKQNGQTKY